MLGLEVLAQLDVAQVAVVGQPRVGGGSSMWWSSATGEALRVGDGHDLADHDDRRRADLLGGDLVGQSVPRVASTVRSSGMVPSTTTATGVSASRPSATRACAMAGAFSTAISITSVPREPGQRPPLDQRVGVAGRQVAGEDGELVRHAAVRDGMPARAGTAIADDSPGTTVTGTPAAGRR